MNSSLFKHVLFKDLVDYVKRDSYFDGYTETEKSWIKKNLGLIGEKEALLLVDNKVAGVKNVTYEEIQKLIKNDSILAGFIYIITDFLSMWLENEEVKSSDPFSILLIAYDANKFLPNIVILNPLLSEATYDITSSELKSGIYNKGTITYLKDANNNEASFDFKNIKLKNGYLFQDINGNENSSNCNNNNLVNATNCYLTGSCNGNILKGNNIVFKVPVSGLIGELNNVNVTNVDFNNDETIKQIIKIDNKYYIDYLDYETLTHLFYVIDAIQ